jgi:hypothetical protein
MNDTVVQCEEIAIVINCDYINKNLSNREHSPIEKVILAKGSYTSAIVWSTVLQWTTGIIPVLPHSVQD